MIILKPDAFERGLVGKILGRFEAAQAEFVRMETGRFNPESCRQHYKAHVGAVYYPALERQMISGISLFVSVRLGWQLVRNIAVKVREDFGVEGPRNLIHASDSQESDESETAYWRLYDRSSSS